MRETLSYAAALRLPNTVDSATQKVIVNQTIEGPPYLVSLFLWNDCLLSMYAALFSLELGLEDAADTVVGGYLRKVGLERGISFLQPV